MKRTFLTLAALLLLLPATAPAADWRVTPVRIDLDARAKSGAVTVSNGPGARLAAQLSAAEWSQDAEGRDRYAETNDLVFFPKILQFEPAQERVVRVGIRSPALRQEKAYRLYIEELPAFDPNRGTSVGVALRFGVPVFVRPPKEEPAGSIASLALDNGALKVRVANGGNVHFTVRTVTATWKDAKGGETFRKELTGWYLLPGASRSYALEVKGDACRASSRVDVEVATDRMALSGSLEVAAASCPP